MSKRRNQRRSRLTKAARTMKSATCSLRGRRAQCHGFVIGDSSDDHEVALAAATLCCRMRGACIARDACDASAKRRTAGRRPEQASPDSPTYRLLSCESSPSARTWAANAFVSAPCQRTTPCRSESSISIPITAAVCLVVLPRLVPAGASDTRTSRRPAPASAGSSVPQASTRSCSCSPLRCRRPPA